MPAFERYLDAVDLSACVDAQEGAGALNARLAAQGAYWPLSLDPAQPLGGLFLTARAASRSFRYGGVGDNVLGLAWRLPNGTRVDLGGRVVKNVAGFDLVRFLAGTQGRFGRPELLVLRLRPRPEAELVLGLDGGLAGMEAASQAIRASSWAHALDALDLEAGPNGRRLVLAFGGKPSVLPLFRDQAAVWARDAGLRLSELAGLPERQPSPWARVLAPVDELPGIAEIWLQRYGGHVSGFLGQGQLNIDALEGDEEGGLRGLHELHRRLAPLGGHCEHPALEPDPEAPQAAWERGLLGLLAGVA